jgi:hypothetical protein
VVTLITRDQVRAAKLLAKAAGINPVTTRLEGPSHPVLIDLAPGERELSGALESATSSPRTRSGGGGGGGRNRNRRRTGRGRPTTGSGGAPRNPKATGQKTSSGGSGRPRRSSARTPSGTGSHSAASFSSGRR